jgi:hypothetical protein
LNLQARGLLLRPSDEGRTGIGPRTPFIVSRTCEPKPTGRAHETFYRTVHTHTVSPSVHPRPASGGAANFFLASALFFTTNRPCDLPVEKTLDASNRRLPPKRSACTRTSRVPGSLSPLSRRGVPTESWAPLGTSGDLDASRRPGSLRRIVFNLRVNSSLLPYGLLTRAWAFSSHGDVAIEPLTPLSRPFVHPPPRSSSRALRLHRSLARARWERSRYVRVGRCDWPPRPPWPPPREERRFVMIRDAFHRQGPFVGSGGRYSPGPTTAPPLLAM